MSQRASCSLPTVGGHNRSWMSAAWKRASPEPDQCWHLSLGLPASRCVRNTSLLFISYPVYGILLQPHELRQEQGFFWTLVALFNFCPILNGHCVGSSGWEISGFPHMKPGGCLSPPPFPRSKQRCFPLKKGVFSDMRWMSTTWGKTIRWVLSKAQNGFRDWVSNARYSEWVCWRNTSSNTGRV